MDKKSFYITTPIYYPSAKLHIGHAYCTTIADSVARFHRLADEEVFFLTGSDEHGQKIQQKAEEQGITPIEYVNPIVAGFQNLWKLLNISNDDFIRTTEKRHEKVVQEVFRRIYAKGDIYKGAYTGLYCKYADRLLKYIEENPDFIQPVSRRNEMINFINQGMEDLCISRTSFDWGIPVPIDDKHVIYVWFDALTNYLTPIGYLDDPEKFQKFWPANIHLVGKEIVRFHSIIWPCILMALDLPLPKQVFGHGWLVVDGTKMSKSIGNVVDPIGLIEEFGADAIRYFLLREINLGQDGNFSRDALIQRINSDLANDLGNLLHRTLNMVGKFQQGVVLAPEGRSEIDASLIEDAMSTVKTFADDMNNMKISHAIKAVWAFISRANKYIDETAPWALAKDESKKQELANTMYNLVEALRVISGLIYPYMPTTAGKLWQQLNLPGTIEELRLADIEKWGGTPANMHIGQAQQLFPRIEVEKVEQPVKAAKNKSEKQKSKKDKQKESQPEGEISIDDFAKIQLRVAKVLEAEAVPKADKLLKLKIDLGDEQRELVSGIAKQYKPEELVGKNVIVVANLKAAKIRGVVSHGMVLAASAGDDLKLVTVDMPVGSVVR